LPEGLQAFATALADIFQNFVASVETTTILGDVTFGACCIDDLASQALGMDFLVHYGHSCIVPVDQTAVTMLYIHVEVKFDVTHLVETVCLNFSPEQNLVFMGTVQFTSCIAQALEALKQEFLSDSGYGKVPQVKPLGVGETLGCTSPHVPEDADVVVFVCDGRFHLESAMIQNPHVKMGFFRYDPFAKSLTREGFAYDVMHQQRRAAIASAKGASLVGLILGTLGRQGSSGILEELERVLDAKGVAHFTLLLSEVSPERLGVFTDVDTWVQVACPRLSLDWGEAFSKPLLTPYEAHVAFGNYAYKDVYPMDYYSNRGGPWSNYGTHNGHGGSLGTKFRHLGHKKHRSVEYESEHDCVGGAF
jgi:2-(3-amino-3-carboxypropyl)histidine synthase